MPPHPKKKISKSRKRRKRMHLSATTSSIATCPNCQSPVLPHHACSVCGTYRGRNIIAVDQKKLEPPSS